MTNYDAVQTPVDPSTKRSVKLNGIKARYLSMGSWHANKSKGGSLESGHLKSVGTIRGEGK